MVRNLTNSKQLRKLNIQGSAKKANGKRTKQKQNY